MRILCFGAILALAGCAHKDAAGPKIDAALDTLVPPDTVLMVGTRLEGLFKTPVYQKNFAGKQFPQVDEFAARTGLDPVKDLWELLFVSNGHQGVLLGRGKFADEMMEPRLQRQTGAERFGYKGLTLIGDERNAMAFISPTTAALGDVVSLHSLIDQRGTSHGPPPRLVTLLKQIPAEAQFWAAYSGGPIHLPFDENSNLGNLNRLLGSLQTGTIYFDLRAGLSGVAEGECTTDAAAQDVEGALKALIGLGRLSVPKNQPDLAQAYDGLRVTQEGHRVKLYVAVPEAIVDKFIGMWTGRSR
jgi:hypothetical protein